MFKELFSGIKNIMYLLNVHYDYIKINCIYLFLDLKNLILSKLFSNTKKKMLDNITKNYSNMKAGLTVILLKVYKKAMLWLR